MSANGAESFLKLLEDKAGYVREMLELTKSFEVKEGELEESAQAYIEMLDKRETAFGRIKQIDDSILALEQAGGSHAAGGEDLKQNIKGLIAQFLEADKKAASDASKINSNLTKSIRSINEGKTTSQLYQNIGMLNTTRFDRSN